MLHTEFTTTQYAAMKTIISSPSVIANSAIPSSAPPVPVAGLVEWSVLSVLAVYLIKSGWKHFSDSDQKDRDADRTLTQTLIEDLRLGNQQRAAEQRQAIKELNQDVIELKGLLAAYLVKVTGESPSEILRRKE